MHARGLVLLLVEALQVLVVEVQHVHTSCGRIPANKPTLSIIVLKRHTQVSDMLHPGQSKRILGQQQNQGLSDTMVLPVSSAGHDIGLSGTGSVGQI